jgi:Phosphatidylinositol kinase and protein kinases of the PI-3 kinase family
MSQGKTWAEWGKWHDRMFKEHPTELSHASGAVSCYLQAVGQYKNAKSRLYITRILWLLSLDDNSFQISRAFDTYKGDAAYWYWITHIPQLCLSTSQREVKQARYILNNLAKLFPQVCIRQ